MSVLFAVKPEFGQIRVAIRAADPLRRIGLESIVTEAGHAVAGSAETADLVLVDGDSAVAEGVRTIALGGSGEGHAGALSDSAGPDQIDAAIRAVASGLIVRAAGPRTNGFAAMTEDSSPLLTPREIEVLVAISEGLGNKAIARKLAISPHTVKFHLESLFRKLGVANRAEAVAKGLARQVIHV